MVHFRFLSEKQEVMLTYEALLSWPGCDSTDWGMEKGRVNGSGEFLDLPQQDSQKYVKMFCPKSYLFRLNIEMPAFIHMYPLDLFLPFGSKNYPHWCIMSAYLNIMSDKWYTALERFNENLKI